MLQCYFLAGIAVLCNSFPIAMGLMTRRDARRPPGSSRRDAGLLANAPPCGSRDTGRGAGPPFGALRVLPVSKGSEQPGGIIRSRVVGAGSSEPGPLNRRSFGAAWFGKASGSGFAPRCMDRVRAPGAFFPLNALKRRQTETGPGISATRAGRPWIARTSSSGSSGPETKTGSACLESSRTPPSVDAFRVLAPVPFEYRGRRAGSTTCRGQRHNFRNIRGGTLRFCGIVSFAHHPWHEAQCARSGFSRRRARRRGVPE